MTGSPDHVVMLKTVKDPPQDGCLMSNIMPELGKVRMAVKFLTSEASQDKGTQKKSSSSGIAR